jgi:hypothetical protein
MKMLAFVSTTSMDTFFNRLLVWKMIDSNPCSGIKSIRVVDTNRPYLSKEDLKKNARAHEGDAVA